MPKRKTDNWYPKPIPGFDVLKWKEETQTEILRETKDMTTEEVLAYFRKGSEEFQREGALYRAKHGIK